MTSLIQSQGHKELAFFHLRYLIMFNQALQYWVRKFSKAHQNRLYLTTYIDVTKKMTLAQKFANNKKIYNFDIIVMKLCKNDQPMSRLYSLNLRLIGLKLWIFQYSPIFWPVSFISLQSLYILYMNVIFTASDLFAISVDYNCVSNPPTDGGEYSRFSSAVFYR